MRNIDFREEFDGVYVFFTTFGYFDDEDNEKVLERIHSALKPGGRVLIDTWNKVGTYARYYNFRSNVIDTWYEAGGYLVLERNELDYENDRIRSTRIFFKDSRRMGEKRFSVRIYGLSEMAGTFRKLGFRMVKTYGDYGGGQYNVGSPRLIVIGEKRPQSRFHR